MKQSVSEKLVSKIAAREGVDPPHLRPPLYAAIDPDALDSIFANSNSTDRDTGSVKFDYAGYHVTVSADQDITLTKLSGGEETAVPGESPREPGAVD